MKHYEIDDLSPGLSQSTRMIQIKYLQQYGIITDIGDKFIHKSGYYISKPSFTVKKVKALRKRQLTLKI